MILKVKLLDQTVHEVDVDPNTLVQDLKAVLEATLNVQSDRQRLIYRGRVLRDESTLQELGIENGHTIHLVERHADAPGPGAQGAQQPAGMDLNRLLQGVFSALGGAAAGPAAQHQQQQPAPPHLLQSIADYLQQLSNPASSSSFSAIPVTSLAPGLPPASTPGGQQLSQACASALQQILQGQQLTEQQQAQLQQLAAGGSSAQPSMQLVLAALSVLLTRAQAYITGPFAAALSTTAQQLADAGLQQVQPSAANQLSTTASGQLQAAAALLIELARAASAASLTAQGNSIALTSNMAAVLRERSAGGLEPSFPTLYPQTSLGVTGGSRAAPAAGTAAAAGSTAQPQQQQQQQQPTGAQIAEMVASALSTSLAPVIQQVSAEVEHAVQTGRARVASGEFEATTSAARAAAAGHVSTTVSRVLNTITDAIHTNVRNIEQRLQQVERQAGRQANAGDIAAAVQQVLLPNLNMQPLGDVIGAAARAAASATAAAQAAQSAATAAGTQVAAQAAAAQAAAAAAAGAQAAAQAAAATAAASEPSAPPAPAPAAAAGPSSSSSSSGQPRGLGLGLKAGALPAKRKAGSAPAGSSAAAAAAAGGDAATAAAAGGASSSDSAADAAAGGVMGRPQLSRKPTPGTLRLSETGRAPAHPGSPRLVPVTEAAEAEAMEGVEQQQQQQAPPDMAALMQMMGGMFDGGGATAPIASMGQQRAAAPRAAAAGGAGDMSGLMQMVGGMLGGGGGAAGGAGGMGGLLQMAGQIASDPAMQPLMSNIASSLLGSGGGAGGSNAAAGGLGSLLSGLLGGPPPGGMGAGNSSSRGAATVVMGVDDLEGELPAETAAEWRRILDEDARVQAERVAQARGPLSEVYLAGAPVKKQSLANLISSSS